MTFSDFKNIFLHDLSGIYDFREISSIFEMCVFEATGFNRLQLHLNYHNQLQPGADLKLAEMLHKLESGMPIQYIIGKTEFYGLSFWVTGDVLIPRQETEELVDKIIKKNKGKAISILDIGAGSGCIAVALKKNIPEAVVYALDKSENALCVARKNADYNNAGITFFQDDILCPDMQKYSAYDIIVSNPPYVTNSERRLMRKNVLDFEPEMALFVDDNLPLVFYRNILDFAKKTLKPGGEIWFEINEMFGTEMIAVLEQSDFSGITLFKDLNSKDRIIYGKRNE